MPKKGSGYTGRAKSTPPDTRTSFRGGGDGGFTAAERAALKSHAKRITKKEQKKDDRATLRRLDKMRKSSSKGSKKKKKKKSSTSDSSSSSSSSSDSDSDSDEESSSDSGSDSDSDSKKKKSKKKKKKKPKKKKREDEATPKKSKSKQSNRKKSKVAKLTQSNLELAAERDAKSTEIEKLHSLLGEHMRPKDDSEDTLEISKDELARLKKEAHTASLQSSPMKGSGIFGTILSTHFGGTEKWELVLNYLEEKLKECDEAAPVSAHGPHDIPESVAKAIEAGSAKCHQLYFSEPPKLKRLQDMVKGSELNTRATRGCKLIVAVLKACASRKLDVLPAGLGLTDKDFIPPEKPRVTRSQS